MPVERLALQIIADGRRRGLWSKDYKPDSTAATFVEFLKEKIKGTRHYINLKMYEDELRASKADESDVLL